MRLACSLLSTAAAYAAFAAAPAFAQPGKERCGDPGHNGIFIQTDTSVFRQGSTVRVVPKFDLMPGGYETIDPHCATDWRISGPAQLSPDRTSFVIAPDAPVGSEIVLSYRWRTERAETRYRVVARNAVVLTGIRGQRSIEGCDGLEPVRELEFASGDRFSVTFTPFETYKDYWGTYSYDPATGALRLQVENGNNVPAGLDLEGRAAISADGTLVLEDMYLGNRGGGSPAGPDAAGGAMPPPSCRYAF